MNTYIRTVCRLIQLSSKIYSCIRSFSKNFKLKRTPVVGSLAFLTWANCSDKVTQKIEFKTPPHLTHEQLIQKAFSSCVNSGSQLLTQTVVALLDIAGHYRQALVDFMCLLEESQAIGGNPAGQQELSDMMIEARARVNDLKQQFLELISLLEYVEKVINSTAEASYLAGAEFLSGTLSERLYSAQQQVESERKKIATLEKEFLLLQSNTIRNESTDKS